MLKRKKLRSTYENFLSQNKRFVGSPSREKLRWNEREHACRWRYDKFKLNSSLLITAICGSIKINVNLPQILMNINICGKFKYQLVIKLFRDRIPLLLGTIIVDEIFLFKGTFCYVKNLLHKQFCGSKIYSLVRLQYLKKACEKIFIYI